MTTLPHLPLHLKNSHLLAQFREFYKELIVRKNSVLSGEGSASPGDAAEPMPEYEPGNIINPIQAKLLEILEKQVPASRRKGGEYGVSYYREAQYIMAALADEVFLGIDWKGRDAWKNSLMEFRLFGTYNAGEVFFQKLEKHINERDPAYAEIASVYLLALSLGFRGKYKDKDDGGRIDLYRQQVFGLIFQKNPDIASENRKLFPAPYDHLITNGERAELPYLKRRIRIFVGLLMLFLLGSTAIWVSLSGDLFQAVDNLILRFTGMAG